MFIAHTAIRYLEPATGWQSQRQLVTVKVTSALPEPTLGVRVRTYPTEHAASRVVHQWKREEVFFVDRETLVVRIPDLHLLDLSDENRVLVF